MELEAGPRAHSHLTARFSMKNRRQKHRKYVIYSNETSVLLNALQGTSLNLYCVYIYLAANNLFRIITYNGNSSTYSHYTALIGS